MRVGLSCELGLKNILYPSLIFLKKETQIRVGLRETSDRRCAAQIERDRRTQYGKSFHESERWRSAAGGRGREEEMGLERSPDTASDYLTRPLAIEGPSEVRPPASVAVLQKVIIVMLI